MPSTVGRKTPATRTSAKGSITAKACGDVNSPRLATYADAVVASNEKCPMRTDSTTDGSPDTAPSAIAIHAPSTSRS